MKKNNETQTTTKRPPENKLLQLYEDDFAFAIDANEILLTILTTA